MPRVYRTKKQQERFLIREFVEYLRYRICNPKWQERPDALLTLVNTKGKKRIAIELTDHFHDTLAGQMSPLTPIGEFWRLVEASLIRRISHRKRLTGIVGNVRFKDKPAFPKRKGKALRIAMHVKAKELAAELIHFLETHPVKPRQWRVFRRRGFGTSPTMDDLLDSFRMSRATNEHVGTSRCSWNCSNVNAGHIAVSMDYIKSAIATKNKKSIAYENWGTAEEKWLLIVAGGGNVSTHAPRFEPDLKWHHPELLELCRDSPFDGIVFWERVGRWCKWLKASSQLP